MALSQAAGEFLWLPVIHIKEKIYLESEGAEKTVWMFVFYPVR